jgi:hypothetical protein
MSRVHDNDLQPAGSKNGQSSTKTMVHLLTGWVHMPLAEKAVWSKAILFPCRHRYKMLAVCVETAVYDLQKRVVFKPIVDAELSTNREERLTL